MQHQDVLVDDVDLILNPIMSKVVDCAVHFKDIACFRLLFGTPINMVKIFDNPI